MISQFILGPLVGGCIGYLTNALAIRMLFRPYTAKHLFGIRVPFTPGIIPKEKGRIATSIGNAISENLMSHEVLERNLLAPEMIAKIDGGIEGFFQSQLTNTETVRQFAARYLGEAEVERLLHGATAELGQQVGASLLQSNLGDPIAEAVVSHVAAKLRVDGLPLGNLVANLFRGKIWDKLADLIQAPARAFLAKNINALLRDRGPEMATAMLDSQLTQLADSRVCDLLAGHEDQLQQARATIVSLYRHLITDELPRILSTVNIGAMIANRINEMDMRETETLIFAVMNKELQAIIWLGAGLGMVMGVLNALF